MGFTKFKFKRDWRNADDFKTIENEEEVVRADMQALHEETKDAIHKLIDEMAESPAAANFGAVDFDSEPSTVQGALDTLKQKILDAVAVNIDKLGSRSIMLDNKVGEYKLAESYGITSLVPTVYEALEKLSPIGKDVSEVAKLIDPVDELVKLAPSHTYMEHWWKRRPAATTFAPVVGAEQSPSSYTYVYDTVGIVSAAYKATQSFTISYADGITHDLSGAVVLVNPTEITLTNSSYKSNFSTVFPDLKGKYVKNDSGYIIYVPDNATASENNTSRGWYCWSKPVCEVYPNVPARNWEDVHSDARNEYPDTGEKDGMEYKYMGVPMDRVAVCGGSERGSYVGTGVYGKTHPNVLDFPFTPSMVIVFGHTQTAANCMFLFNTPLGGVCVSPASNTSTANQFAVSARPVFTGNSVSWYSTSTATQANNLGQQYCYVAFR